MIDFCYHATEKEKHFSQLECLVLHHGEDLRAPGCDRALDLVEAVMDAAEKLQDETVKKQIIAHLHKAISK